MMSDVAAFQSKLILITQQLDVRNFTHFAVLPSQVSRSASFSSILAPNCAYLTDLKEEFSSRFADIKFLETMLAFTENLFVCDVQVTSGCVTTITFEVEQTFFEEQLIDLQHNNILKERRRGDHCRLLVDVCSEEIVRSINSVFSENLDLLLPREQSNQSRTIIRKDLFYII